MRLIAAIAGILTAVPPLVFFWIGTQTFLRPLERALSLVVTTETAALLLVSVAMLVTPSVQPLQAILLAATVIRCDLGRTPSAQVAWPRPECE